MEYGFSDRIRFIDTHAGGEPTRIVIEGGPDLGKGSMAERRKIFRTKYDHFRSAVVNEPRGSDVFVGALLCEPTDPTCVAGVIFLQQCRLLGNVRARDNVRRCGFGLPWSHRRWDLQT